MLFPFLLPLKGVRGTSPQPDPDPQPKPDPKPQPTPEPTSEPLPDRCNRNLIFDAATTIQRNLYFFKDGSGILFFVMHTEVSQRHATPLDRAVICILYSTDFFPQCVVTVRQLIPDLCVSFSDISGRGAAPGTASLQRQFSRFGLKSAKLTLLMSTREATLPFSLKVSFFDLDNNTGKKLSLISIEKSFK